MIINQEKPKNPVNPVQTDVSLEFVDGRPQGAQSSEIPVTTYEKATASRFRTRMTRIGRIFTDTCAYVFDYFPSDQQTLSYLKLLENKPQINADERRFIVSASEYISLNLKTFNSRSNYS